MATVRQRVLFFATLGGLVGCMGIVEGDVSRDTDAPNAWVCRDTSEVALGTSPLRRLTNVEYQNTVRDLFGGAVPALPAQPDDALRAGTFENDARSLGPSDVRVSRWEDAAMRLGAFAVENATARARVLPCSPQSNEAACGRTLVESFGRRAMRRPLEDDEVDRYAAFFEAKRAEIDFDAAMQLTIAAMLQSPQFLYRVELPGEASRSRVGAPLTAFETASRMSYFLWESMPDDTLLAAAESGALATEAQVAAQAMRMLADPRALTTIRHFHRQWLHLDRVLTQTKVPGQFPGWSDAARQAATEESERFVEDVFTHGGTFHDLMTSRVGFVNDALAPLYGVPAPGGGDFARVELPPERAGILSRVAFLAGHAHDANGSPPLRGVFVLSRLLCEPPSSPPANADTTAPTPRPDEGPVTNRTLFERRTAPPTCQACHRRIDPLGYAFEHFDAAGIFREFDNGLPVNASGTVTRTDNDGAFNGASELQSRLAETEVVERCVVRQWYRYAYGRMPEEAETCHVERLQRRFIDSGGNIRDLLVGIVTSPEFRLSPALASE